MNQAGLTQGPIKDHILKMAVPMGFGLLAVMSFQVIDMIFVGMLGEESLAAISFIFPLIFIVLGLGMGIGVGTMSHVGFFLGRQDVQSAKRIATHGLLLVSALSLGIAFVGWISIDLTLSSLGIPENIQAPVKRYMEIWYMASCLIMLPIVGNSVIRATGDSKTPSLIMSVAGMTNIVLDPLLIFGYGPIPAMGFQGAAIATAFSYLLTLIASLSLLHFKLKMMTAPSWNFHMLQDWKKILYIGVPVSLTASFAPLSQAILMKFVASEGVFAAAAFGVSFRIEAFATIGIMALANVMSPIVSQNYGAQQLERIEDCFWVSLRWSALWCGGVTLLLIAISQWIGLFFSSEKDLIKGIALYCWIVPMTYWWQGVLDFLVAVMNSLQQPFLSLMLIVIRLFILTIPLGYVGVDHWGLEGLYAGRAIANVIAGLLAAFIAFHFIKKSLRPHVSDHGFILVSK
ncbi:MAG: MATE family efflux transporter [Oligoflexales bacterium]